MPKAGVKVGLGFWSEAEGWRFEAEGWGFEAGEGDKNVDWRGAPKHNNKYINLNNAKRNQICWWY